MTFEEVMTHILVWVNGLLGYYSQLRGYLINMEVLHQIQNVNSKGFNHKILIELENKIPIHIWNLQKKQVIYSEGNFIFTALNYSYRVKLVMWEFVKLEKKNTPKKCFYAFFS